MTAAAFFSSTANWQSPPGVWNFKGSSWKCLRGSLKSKSDGLWTACECTETSELIFFKRFSFSFMRQIEAGSFRGVWCFTSDPEEFTSEVQRVRGEQVTLPGGFVFCFLLGKETLNGKMMVKWQFSSRSWALVHDYRMTARAMRRRPAMKQQPWVVHLFENMVYVRYVAGLKSKNVPRELSNI